MPIVPLVFWMILYAVAGPARLPCSEAESAAERPDASFYAAWRPLLAGELRQDGWKPEPQDLYKFLHQGVLGPAHAIGDTAAVRAWLQREWEIARGLPPDGRPAMLLPLRPDGRLVRVDLVRLYHHTLPQGSNSHETEAAVLDTLLCSFVATADQWPGEPLLLQELWAAVCADTVLWADVFSPEDLAELHSRVSVDWPSVRHSEIYRSEGLPHYRVVELDLLPQGWRSGKGAP